jgi:hypothetical protein
VSTDDFLSGTTGEVVGPRAVTRALLADALDDGLALASGRSWRLKRAALAAPRRRVLALAVQRTGEANLIAHARAELERSTRHDVRFVAGAVGDRGKFENVDLLLAANPPQGYDWLLVVDDDVALPRGFLDAFIFLAERFDLKVAQPAHRHRSHAAWAVTRRRRGSVVRETAYVESGPLAAFHRDTFELLLPFPPLRAGWGLDAHWSALVRDRGWRLGVVDATPIGHRLRLIAASYDRSAAIAEGREFLAGKRYVPAEEAQRTLVAHRTWT